MSESGSQFEGRARFSRITSRLFGRERSAPQQSIPHTQPAAEENSLSIAEELERVRNIDGISEALAIEDGQEKFVHANPLKNVADLINQHGIYCAHNGLSGVAQRIPDEGDDRFHPFVIRHNGYRYNSIITLPELPEDLRLPLQEKNKEYALYLDRAKLLRRELPKNQKVGGGNSRRYEYYLPARYIQGYLDIEKGGFVKNEQYDPVIDEEEHIRLKHIIDTLTPESYHEFN